MSKVNRLIRVCEEKLEKIKSIFFKKGYLKSRGDIFVGKKNCFYYGKISLRGKIKIGNYCAIGENLKIRGSNHNFNYPALQHRFYKKNFSNSPKNISKGVVEIGSDVWFGDDVTILSGAKIGNGAIIGAGSVVTKEVSDYALVAGVPAKFIKYRFKKEIRDFLLELKWWEWSEDKIKRNKEFFMTNLNEIKSVDELKRIIKD